MNLILCGPPFVGKTTLGQDLAQNLRWQFKDTDRLLEKTYYEENKIALTCRDIHREVGEEQFRLYEKKALFLLKESQDCIIALGGGTLNDVSNAELLKELGIILYLKAPLEVLQKRVMEASWPSYLEKEKEPLKAYQKLVELRSISYEQHAHHILDIKFLERDQIVQEILKVFKNKASQYGK